jgi:hypothetical protein
VFHVVWHGSTVVEVLTRTEPNNGCSMLPRKDESNFSLATEQPNVLV